ncbi:DMT family transporter [Roseovarius rhodophyticola]|uniref:DMT family transporter n=1 Tax=Roseovarius rhodophyticola TaxID=3080827 RepID=A0ABZ2TF56_9RHOB|nr:DMT family transporter [Roseovarius sp. W115]MDV2928171.1 DMT family transporter [Roseovarius sp. W115]
MSADADKEHRTNILRAAFWMLGAVGSFSLMAVAGREVSFELDTFEIMTYRSLAGIVIVLTIVILTGRQKELRTQRLGLHISRNIFHFAGQNLWFFALTLIPLAQLFALEFTTPLWVLILSPIFLGERLTNMRVLSALIGFIGILIVARPSPETLNIGTMTAAAAAIGFAGAMIFTKKLTRTETLACIMFWLTLTQSIFGLICAGIDGDMALPSTTSAPWLIVIAICGLLAHFCITSALSIAPATLVSPIDFTRLPVIALVGYVLYNEPIDGFVILGALIIFGANYLNLWSETRKKPKI